MATTKDTALAKGSFYWFSPRALTIVRNPDHPLWDKRAIEPPDPDLMSSLAEFGNHESIKIQNVQEYVDERGKVHKGAILVANGRRRVIAAQALEAKQRSQNAPDVIRIKCEYVKGTGDDAPMAAMVISNAHRKAEDPAELARKALRLQAMGRTPREIANLFGVDPATARNWLALGSGPREILDAVEKGTLPAAEGYKAAKKGKRAPRPPSPVLPRKGIKAALEAFTPIEGEPEDTTCDVVRATLEWVLGIDPEAKGLKAYGGSAWKLAKKVRGE